MLAGQQEAGRRLPAAEGRQRRAAGEAFSARRRRERGVKGAKKGQGGGQIGPGRRLGTWLKAACALARQGAGSLGVSAAGRARAGGGGRVCSSCQSVPQFRMFTNSRYKVCSTIRCTSVPREIPERIIHLHPSGARSTDAAKPKAMVERRCIPGVLARETRCAC